MENEFLVLSGEGSMVPITGRKGQSTSIGENIVMPLKSDQK